MERLNYFNPYLTRATTHEDQLTRAYLVLLRHSFHAFAIFFEYCRSRHVLNSVLDEQPLEIIQLLEEGWEIDTQLTNPVIGTNWLLSVLITDARLPESKPVAASDRTARYDGYMQFGSQVTFIIENKPRSGNVWFGQLNPSREGLSEDTRIYTNAVHLEWKEIIGQLNHLNNLASITGYEKMMIGDFLSFVDHHFPFLNPYDYFHLCKGNEELIQRRIQNLLKSIVNNEESVKHHFRWGFSIITPYREIKEIGLIFGKHETQKSWWLELSMYFGDIQSQAWHLYALNPSIDHLDKEEWEVSANFHVAYRSSNLVYFRDVPDLKKYIDFWKTNIDDIRQHKKQEVPGLIEWLKEEQVINITKENEEELDRKFFNTAMPVLNICPGFGAIYTITGDEAETLDRTGELKKMLITAIQQGLKIIGKDGSEFLKVLSSAAQPPV